MQPETTLTLDAYSGSALTTKVISRPRPRPTRPQRAARSHDHDYGVDAALMVAVWGMESNFGQFLGSRPVIAALATLAYNGRRTLFRNELLDA